MNEIAQAGIQARPTPLQWAALPHSLWSTEVKIHFGQCDPAGIVYTPKYFDIFNTVIEDWYEQVLGLNYYEFIGTRRIGLGYVNAHSDFFATCTMGDRLRVAVDLERIGNSSFVIVLHAFQNKSEALRGRFTVVTTDLLRHRPIPIPDDLRAALLDYAKSWDKPAVD